ncbi:hypothetical protein Aglo01_00620 [Actinokineospora globicatena]|nr:hypothetical protein Aglo01_00620 [Actinokineospora globicatena]GLW82420.1 hypothetical protein Aglo02_00610 [Actinokineospora globicatena]
MWADPQTPDRGKVSFRQDHNPLVKQVAATHRTWALPSEQGVDLRGIPIE